MPLAPREARATRLRAWPLACAASLALHGVVWAWCGSWTWDSGATRAQPQDEFVFELRLRVGGSTASSSDDMEGSMAREAPSASSNAAAELVPESPSTFEAALAPAHQTTLAQAQEADVVVALASSAPAPQELPALEPTFAPSMAVPPAMPTFPVTPVPSALAVDAAVRSVERDADASRAMGPTSADASVIASREHTDAQEATTASEALSSALSASASDKTAGAPSSANSPGAVSGTIAAGAPISTSSANSPGGSNSSGGSGRGAGDANGDGAEGASSNGTRDVVAISTPRPVYPHESELRGEYGVVTCLLHVDERGIVTRVDVLATSGYQRLDRAAVEGLKRWRFEPALVDGKPAAGTLRHQVRFVFR